MAEIDELLATVEAIHAAGIDAARWPQALAAVTRAVGGTGATLEVFERTTLMHRDYHSFGLPAGQEKAYLAHYCALNPRLPYSLRMKAGELGWDRLVLDEAAMDRCPFYSEFLPAAELRYWICGILEASPDHVASVSVQRARKQGHVDLPGIAAMRALVPHVRQALDVAMRLRDAAQASASLEGTLEWMADGVALVRPDGAVDYANAALYEIARRNDGIRIRKGALDLGTAEARAWLGNALGEIARATPTSLAADFTVIRGPGSLPYLLSLRPLARNESAGTAGSRAVAILFVRDPSSRDAVALRTLRDVFGFTEAEAAVAQALQAGVPLPAYASSRALSLNTVYTHLRRIKEKTGCNRMAELIRKLNDLHMPLRPD